jgi:hypothetical protein
MRTPARTGCDKSLYLEAGSGRDRFLAFSTGSNDFIVSWDRGEVRSVDFARSSNGEACVVVFDESLMDVLLVVVKARESALRVSRNAIAAL